jgi:glycosyltransferase involved in cell wall biosynthesis
VRATVIVPAFNAAATIGRTLDALARQSGAGEFETIVVDDGSTDDTVAIARAAPGVRVLTQRQGGAAAARNRGAAEASGEVLAFTDSDCMPTPGWLAAGLRALADADVVQGRVTPPPGVALGPFDRSLWIERETGLWETANLLVRRELFERVGGFEGWLEHGGGRPMAEDTWFGWRARRAGARTAYCAEALVHHEVFPRGPLGFVQERERLRYFPAIARQMPELRDEVLYRRWFLTRRTAAFDAAVAGLALAAWRRSPLPLAAAGPYAAIAAGEALAWGRRRAPAVAAVRLAADAVGLAALLEGSVRHRSPLA